MWALSLNIKFYPQLIVGLVIMVSKSEKVLSRVLHWGLGAPCSQPRANTTIKLSFSCYTWLYFVKFEESSKISIYKT